MHILDALICMHVLNVLLLLLETKENAPLFWEFQPQSNKAAGSVVPKTTVLSSTAVLKHKYASIDIAKWMSRNMMLQSMK